MPADDAVWLDLGLALYRRRIDLGIGSQRELAARAGVHHNTVSRLERGQPWSRRGRAWTAIEAALGLEEGWIASYIANYGVETGPVMTTEAVERAVLDSVTEHAPHLPIRQARAIAAATARRLEQQGLLPPARPGR
jgi:transcriptional regulator with XRE-family HTH domain